MNRASCYRFEKIEYADGLLSKCVDATYVIHLEGNGRLEAVKKQLAEYHTTNLVYIVLNKGYKKCEKPEYVKNSARDLVDANLQIFKHAEQQGYGNILVLEDDVIFSEKIKEQRHRDNICKFLKNTENSISPYCLGCAPNIIFPVDLNNYAGVMGGMHCVIFNKNTRQKILPINPEKIKEWDGYFYTAYPYYQYMYYLPLCYQLWPETENSKNWGAEYGILQVCVKLMTRLHKLLKLDKQVEPGYTILYIFAKMFGLLFFLAVILFIYKLGKIIIKVFPKISKHIVKWQKKSTS